MHEPTYKYFNIIVKAKLMCISYIIYDVQSNESKDTKIICILVTTVWEKGNMIIEGFMTCHWMRKKCYSRLTYDVMQQLKINIYRHM